MKKTPPLGIAIASILFSAALAHSSDLYWTPQGGSTAWDTTAQNWSPLPGGGSQQAWGASVSNGDVAVFQGTGEPVLLGSSLSAGGLKFTSNQFSLSAASARTLTLTGSAPAIDVASGLTATLGANVRVMGASKSFTKTGAGTLEVTYSTSTDYYFGNITAGTAGAKVAVEEGVLKVSGSAFNNTYTEVAVSANAEMQVNATLNLGGLSGAGKIDNASGTRRTLQLRGLNTDFGGVISGNLNLTKINALDAQTFSGSQSNTFIGTTTVSVGELILAKTGGATAISGDRIVLGTNSGSSVAKVTLAGDGQIAATTGLSFADGNTRDAILNLGGYSATLGNLTLNGIGAGGSYTIDYGLNAVGQILSFGSLVSTGTGTLQILNFGGNDELRFTADPTANLPRIQFDGGQAYAFDRGGYWSVTSIPEPGSVSMVLGGAACIAAGLWLRPAKK